MPEQNKTIAQINESAAQGRISVFTEVEILETMRQKTPLTAADVDVVVMAFPASLSGSAVFLLVPVAQRGEFTRARRIWLNGVRGYPGPAPNERLGVVDTLVFAREPNSDPKVSYTGEDLFADLLGNRSIEAQCLSVEGDTYRHHFKMGELQFARCYCYNVFFPESRLAAGGRDSGANCHFDTIKVGAKVLLNGAPGVVVGSGTRSGLERRSLSLAADMFEMQPGAIERTGADDRKQRSHSVALAIPVLNDNVLDAIKGYLAGGQWQEQSRFASDLDEAAASDLKALVASGRFLLASSARSPWTAGTGLQQPPAQRGCPVDDDP